MTNVEALELSGKQSSNEEILQHLHDFGVTLSSDRDILAAQLSVAFDAIPQGELSEMAVLNWEKQDERFSQLLASISPDDQKIRDVCARTPHAGPLGNILRTLENPLHASPSNKKNAELLLEEARLLSVLNGTHKSMDDYISQGTRVVTIKAQLNDVRKAHELITTRNGYKLTTQEAIAEARAVRENPLLPAARFVKKEYRKATDGVTGVIYEHRTKVELSRKKKEASRARMREYSQYVDALAANMRFDKGEKTAERLLDASSFDLPSWVKHVQLDQSVGPIRSDISTRIGHVLTLSSTAKLPSDIDKARTPAEALQMLAISQAKVLFLEKNAPDYVTMPGFAAKRNIWFFEREAKRILDQGLDKRRSTAWLKTAELTVAFSVIATACAPKTSPTIVVERTPPAGLTAEPPSSGTPKTEAPQVTSPEVTVIKSESGLNKTKVLTTLNSESYKKLTAEDKKAAPNLVQLFDALKAKFAEEKTSMSPEDIQVLYLRIFQAKTDKNEAFDWEVAIVPLESPEGTKPGFQYAKVAFIDADGNVVTHNVVINDNELIDKQTAEATATADVTEFATAPAPKPATQKDTFTAQTMRVVDGPHKGQLLFAVTTLEDGTLLYLYLDPTDVTKTLTLESKQQSKLAEVWESLGVTTAEAAGIIEKPALVLPDKKTELGYTKDMMGNYVKVENGFTYIWDEEREAGYRQYFSGYILDFRPEINLPDSKGKNTWNDGFLTEAYVDGAFLGEQELPSAIRPENLDPTGKINVTDFFQTLMMQHMVDRGIIKSVSDFETAKFWLTHDYHIDFTTGNGAEKQSFGIWDGSKIIVHIRADAEELKANMETNGFSEAKSYTVYGEENSYMVKLWTKNGNLYVDIAPTLPASKWTNMQITEMIMFWVAVFDQGPDLSAPQSGEMLNKIVLNNKGQLTLIEFTPRK